MLTESTRGGADRRPVRGCDGGDRGRGGCGGGAMADRLRDVAGIVTNNKIALNGKEEG